jgi:UDP-N-acetylmuramate--alanine ligase
MHIYFSAIGGTAMAPLAYIASQAGHTVTGSDKQESQYIDWLRNKGLTDINIGQERENIAKVHAKNPIDWYVYSSAVAIEQPNGPELTFCRQQAIKMSKRDDLLNQIISDKQLKLLAVAGTHGKTTTTAMVIWLFKQLGLPVSYSVGAKIPFGDMGQYETGSEYFIYEADEFDRNFLAFEPYLSLITGVSWDHHEIFPTREDYQDAFREFIEQSQHTILWAEDFTYLGCETDTRLLVQDSAQPEISQITLAGAYNRLDAWLAIQAVHKVTSNPIAELIQLMDKFPGLQRRMEQIKPGLYSDYAHTPEKVRGAMSVALEMASTDQPLVIIYEPLTNRRQHFMLKDYKDCFDGGAQVYWLPSYLAREDPTQRIIEPAELISHLDDPTIASPALLNDDLKRTIEAHLHKGDMVVGMAGGGGGSLDEWLRQNFSGRLQNH